MRMMIVNNCIAMKIMYYVNELGKILDVVV